MTFIIPADGYQGMASQQKEFERRHKRAKRYLGKATRNAALGFLELYKIKQRELWRAGFNSEGEPYSHWEHYLEEFVFEVADVSRAKVYGRMTLIGRLERGLGWGIWAIYRALQSPAVAADALKKLADWERGTGKFKGFKSGAAQVLADPLRMVESPADCLSEIVQDAIALPRGEGRKHISEMAGEIRVWARLQLGGRSLFIIVRNDALGKEYQFQGPIPDDTALGWLEGRFGETRGREE